VAGDRKAGDSARAEYERRKGTRRQRHQERFGRFASLTMAIDGKRSSEEVWRKGADGEEFTARRLEKHLASSGVAALHDLRIPGSRANIDHVYVAVGGVTVVDSKNYTGRVRIRSGELWINGRRKTTLIEGIQRQVGHVRTALGGAQLYGVDVEAALSMANFDGLPLFGSRKVDGVLVDGPKPIAKLVRRSPRGAPAPIDLVVAAIRHFFA
jgi:hypothetical protein